MSTLAEVQDSAEQADAMNKTAVDARNLVNTLATQGASPEGVARGLVSVNAHATLWLAAEVRALRIAMTAQPTHSITEGLGKLPS